MDKKKLTWREAEGDKTLALDWPIDSDALVWEIGGYEGRWAAQMAEKFHPHLHVFEPQLWAFYKMQERFEDNLKVLVEPFGLWTHNTILRMYEHDTDGASVVRQDGRTEGTGEFRDIYHFLNPVDVDVCLMNVEGGEYVLLPYMIGLGLMSHIRFFWCQFHPGLIESGDAKTNLIFKGMKRTHKLLWNFSPVAVAWERK